MFRKLPLIILILTSFSLNAQNEKNKKVFQYGIEIGTEIIEKVIDPNGVLFADPEFVTLNNEVVLNLIASCKVSNNLYFKSGIG